LPGRRTVQYDCGAEAPIAVTYINAAPNFLVVVPVEEEPEALVFASVLSDSGVRYAAGRWLWVMDGSDASLHDVTLSEAADPMLSCSEISNTP
jgi:membrane-bound inhibitor of C-type lysozyme